MGKPTVLPPKALREVLVEFYRKNLFVLVPVIDQRDIALLDSSLLLQQAVYFAGSLTCHIPDSTPFSPEDIYCRIKTLLFLNHEKDPYVTLKALCLVGCWNSDAPQLVSLDSSWQWSGMAIRLALPLGLHRANSSAYARSDQRCLRRIWWYLFDNDTLQSACFGRPSMISIDDFDVPLPTPDDFDLPDMSAQVFCHLAKLCPLINGVHRQAIRRNTVAPDEIAKLLLNLQEWIAQLPSELQLYDQQGSRKEYNRVVSELHVFYLACIVLIYLLPGTHRHTFLLCKTAIVASSCVARLYESMLYREGRAASTLYPPMGKSRGGRPTDLLFDPLLQWRGRLPRGTGDYSFCVCATEQKLTLYPHGSDKNQPIAAR
ncbi:hypothetical protein ARAM_003964 [Aspergillus rambellii]|uniref:Xylanolytic transcriptional activator regulatory domain-containing protein n=1 Tax=Aspergillus rambellii TaxID=308745 RepID=A0A0F8X1A0_9EURO|nr:hypothetical protein ARAM_003964 [Aspergillus rambellii]